MAILKPFRVQIVDSDAPDATVIHDVGSFLYPVLEWKANAPKGSSYPNNSAYFSAYTDDYLQIGGADLSGVPSHDKYNTSFSRLLEIAPLAVNRSLYGLTLRNNYIRIISPNGYYAADKILGSAGSMSMSRFFSPSGQSMGIAVWFSFGYGFLSSVCRIACTSATLSGRMILSAKQQYYCEGMDTGNREWQVIVDNITQESSVILSTWLNECANFEPVQQSIPVQWARPWDGKVLSDSFAITVSPASESSGETGEESGGNTGSGEGGGGGGHSF